MEKEKMMKEQQQVKEEVKTEVQEQDKVDPLVKKEIVKVENFNFLRLYFFLLYTFISINNLSIFLNMYSFLTYSLYRGSRKNKEADAGGADGEGEEDEGVAAGEGGGEDGGSGTGESGSAGEEGDREGEGRKFQLFTTLLFSII